MGFFSLRHAAEIFGRDKNTVHKHARRLQAEGKLVLRKDSHDSRAILIDFAGMDALARLFGVKGWRRKAAESQCLSVA